MEKNVKSTTSVMSGLFWVEKQERKDGEDVGEPDRKEQVAIRVFETEPARVTMSGGATIGMAKFQFMRVDVGLSVPCYLEEVPEVAAKVKATLERHLQKEVSEIMAQRERGGFGG